MNVIRNIQFTLLIRIGKQQHEFNFRQRTPSLYDTDTADERGDRHFFKMIQAGDHWRIEPGNLPAWIHANESAISEALHQNTV